MNKIVIILVIQIFSISSEDKTHMVYLKSRNGFSSVSVPLAKEPILNWIEIQSGIYPEILPFNERIDIGKPATLLIYSYDRSGLYDFQVDECWAYDTEDYQSARSKLKLSNSSLKKSGRINNWQKVKQPSQINATILLYADFLSFKFPDSDIVYINCIIKLCYKECKLKKQDAIAK